MLFTLLSLKDANIFLWIAASVVDTAAVNSNGVKTLLACGLGIFFIKGNPVYSNCPRKVYVKNFLDVLFYATEFLITLY